MLSCVIVHSVICEDDNILECVLHNFHTQRKQKDVVCRGWVLNPRPSNNPSDRVAQLV